MNALDVMSPTWLAVKAECEKAIAAANDANGAPNVLEREADLQRGRLQLAKEILALATPRPVVDAGGKAYA